MTKELRDTREKHLFIMRVAVANNGPLPVTYSTTPKKETHTMVTFKIALKKAESLYDAVYNIAASDPDFADTDVLLKVGSICDDLRQIIAEDK